MSESIKYGPNYEQETKVETKTYSNETKTCSDKTLFISILVCFPCYILTCMAGCLAYQFCRSSLPAPRERE